MPDWLYDGGPNAIWVFLVVTVGLGGAAAYVSGRAIAETWRPAWQLPLYVLLCCLAVRFIHFALFEEKLLSLRSLLVDYAILLAFGAIGAVRARRWQMHRQYRWLSAGDGGGDGGLAPK